jgi:hypothetical protein
VNWEEWGKHWSPNILRYYARINLEVPREFVNGSVTIKARSTENRTLELLE